MLFMGKHRPKDRAPERRIPEPPRSPSDSSHAPKSSSRGDMSSKSTSSKPASRKLRDLSARNDAASKPVSSKLPNLASRASLALGVIWDIVVLFSFGALFVCANLAIGSPSIITAAHPLWLRIIEFYGLIIIPAAALAYLLADLRPLRARFPNVRLLHRQRSWVLDPLLVVALSFCITAFANYTHMML